jgi:DNA-binding MarR family transcriptional regulator
MHIHIIMPPRPQAPRHRLVDDAREVAGTCPALAARETARRLTRHFDGKLRGTGLNHARFALMAQVAAATDDTIGALAARCGLDPSTLSRNLRGLERAGLVEIASVEADLRRRAVWLTETGARRLAAAIPAWRRAKGTLRAP